MSGEHEARQRKIPAPLREAYAQACNEEGQPFADFVEAVRARFDPEDLLALIDEVEETVLSNMVLMAEANPGLEAVAHARAEGIRSEMEALRARLREGR